MKCRHCSEELTNTFVNLGSSPPSNSYLTYEDLKGSERWYPLKVMVCNSCWLVQTEDFVGFNEMFSDEYAYFSSYSTSWLEHANKYVSEMSNKFHLTSDSLVVEIASNDGYLLQYVKEKNIPCLGIEPTKSTANAARAKGIETIEEFFGVDLANKLVKEGRQADLTAANNVLAHLPDINDFVKGFSILLKSTGVSTFEFPYLVNLVKFNQFDTIYHEHYSYLSLTSVHKIFKSNGLTVFDVEEIPTHGGSLRVYAQRTDNGSQLVSDRVKQILDLEEDAGINTIGFYKDFNEKTEKVKNDLLLFLIEAKNQGKKVAAYGAAAKGNTIMNYAGIKEDLITYVVDLNPAKQNKFMPGSRIGIVDQPVLEEDKPDYVIILPWNLKEEIIMQLKFIKDWGGKFVTAVPEIHID